MKKLLSAMCVSMLFGVAGLGGQQTREPVTNDPLTQGQKDKGQTETSQTDKGQMDAKGMMKDGSIALSGCVTAGQTAGTYMLTNAMMTNSMMNKGMMNDKARMDAKAKTADKAGMDQMSKGMSHEAMMSYELVGSNLSEHVGHKVEVIATMSKMDLDRMATMDKMDSVARNKMMADKAMKAMRLNVTSLKMISATCQ